MSAGPRRESAAAASPRAGRRLLTFDCYGTLIDWESGILAALRAAYPGSETLSDSRLLEEFHAAQNALKTQRYRSYRELLTEVALALAGRHGWEEWREVAGTIPASIPEWRPFPDTNPALRRLAGAGDALGILSNIDDDLLAGTLRHFEVAFDHLGTAQSLRSYKPAAAHFERGREWAAEYRDWCHVAQSLFHDVVPATRLGIQVVWVDRKSEAPSSEARPAFTAPSLAAAAEWLLSDPSR